MDSVCQNFGIGGVSLGQYNGEFLSAVPAADIRSARCTLDSPGDLLENLIADLVTEGIVELLEMIKID